MYNVHSPVQVIISFQITVMMRSLGKLSEMFSSVE